MTAGLRVDSWTKLNCSDRVAEIDGRHEGRVEAIINYDVRVKRDDTGWISFIPLDEVVRVRRVAYDPRLKTTFVIGKRA